MAGRGGKTVGIKRRVAQFDANMGKEIFGLGRSKGEIRAAADAARSYLFAGSAV